MNGNLNIVIIEWDGGHPPTKWYNRLNSLGLSVRSGKDNKETSPLSRRFSEHGIIHQEGTILVPSASTAHVLAHLARELGAKAVSVGTIQLEELEMSYDDIAAIERIQNTLGKRGRPTAKSNWVITCLDEMKSYEWEGVTPVACPVCGSFKITQRIGNQEVLSVNWNDDLLDIWQSTRFLSGSFEVPNFNQFDGVPCSTNNVVELPETSRIRKSFYKKVKDALKAGEIDEEKALHLIDCAYASAKLDDQTRTINRVLAIKNHIQRGGSQSGVVLAANGNIDVFDVYQFDNSVFSIPSLTP